MKGKVYKRKRWGKKNPAEAGFYNTVYSSIQQSYRRSHRCGLHWDY